MELISIISIISRTLLGLAGVSAAALACFRYRRYLLQPSRCTSAVAGKVTGYSKRAVGGRDSGVYLPEVAYEVDGEAYSVFLEYRSYRTNSDRSYYSQKRVTVKEDRHNNLIITYPSVSFGLTANPFKQKYPVGKAVEVHYCPDTPKLAYAERYCDRRIYFWISALASGIAFAAICFV